MMTLSGRISTQRKRLYFGFFSWGKGLTSCQQKLLQSLSGEALGPQRNDLPNYIEPYVFVLWTEAYLYLHACTIDTCS
jgi:hypothetical protein